MSPPAPVMTATFALGISMARTSGVPGSTLLVHEIPLSVLRKTWPLSATASTTRPRAAIPRNVRAVVSWPVVQVTPESNERDHAPPSPTAHTSKPFLLVTAWKPCAPAVAGSTANNAAAAQAATRRAEGEIRIMRGLRGKPWAVFNPSVKNILDESCLDFHFGQAHCGPAFDPTAGIGRLHGDRVEADGGELHTGSLGAETARDLGIPDLLSVAPERESGTTDFKVGSGLAVGARSIQDGRPNFN